MWPVAVRCGALFAVHERSRFKDYCDPQGSPWKSQQLFLVIFEIVSCYNHTGELNGTANTGFSGSFSSAASVVNPLCEVDAVPHSLR